MAPSVVSRRTVDFITITTTDPERMIVQALLTGISLAWLPSGTAAAESVLSVRTDLTSLRTQWPQEKRDLLMGRLWVQKMFEPEKQVLDW